MREWLAEFGWLGGAAAAAWLLPRTFLAIEGVALLISLTLFLSERKIAGNAG